MLKTRNERQRPMKYTATSRCGKQLSRFMLMIFAGAMALGQTAMAVAPLATSVTSTDGHYAIGNDIYVTVTFDQVVTVTGSPTLELELGANREMAYLGGSGTAALTFRHTVLTGDFSSDLEVTSPFALQLNGGTIQNGALENWPGSIPAGGAAGSLKANNAITVGTARLTLDGNTTVQIGQSATWTVTRDVSVGALTVNLASATPGVASVPVSVNIIDGDVSATFSVTGVTEGGPVTITASAASYQSGTRDMTVTGKILSFLPPLGSTANIDEGTSETGWRLQRSGATGFMTATLTPSTLNVVTLNPPTVTFSGTNEYSNPFTISAIDDTPAPAGINLTATASDATYNSPVQSITVLNRDPVITSATVPTNGMTVGISRSFTFNALDAAGSQDTLTGRWDFGDGTVVTNVASGDSVSHAYAQPGDYTVLLRVEDEDGGQTSAAYAITVDEGIALSVTVLSGGYAGIGTGSFLLSPTAPLTNGVYRFAEGAQVTITAIPNPANYFYEWGGDVPDGLTDTHMEGPGCPLTLSLTMDDDKNITLLFSREHMPEDLDGDLDGDWLPDHWEVDKTLDPRSAEDPNGTFHNSDGDFLPGVVGYVYPEVPLDEDLGYMPDPEHGFHNFFEYAGFDGTNGTPDDRNLDPLDPDTDEDGLGDGWEYYFWGNAVNNTGMVGRAYDPLNITNSIVISNATIISVFDPTISGGADMDPDNDGLKNVEEMVLGTSPIDWDTDGDGMPDGWEVLRQLLPLDAVDGGQNPDNDWMAELNNLQHWDVYLDQAFDPRTAWAQNYYNAGRSPQGQENTREYQNLDEFLVAQYLMDHGYISNAVPDEWDETTTDPLNIDTDADGIADGWELYVNFMPVGFYSGHPEAKFPDAMTSAADAGIDLDGDGLSNLAEFRCYDLQTEYPSDFPVLDAEWQNKFWPTDPWDSDTDADQVADGAEGGAFKYGGGVSTALAGGSYAGGGLNPCSCDTDADALPDLWEMLFLSGDGMATNNRTGMDGTVADATGLDNDYDGDGLENYQEYWINAVYHFQHPSTDPGYPAWTAGLGFGGYDPADFFQGVPYAWDWHAENNMQPYTYIMATTRPGPEIHFACTDPRDPDSDGDNMDDFYEMYHGLNPIFGTYDIVYGWNIQAGLPDGADIRTQPWTIGSQAADPDQDGLPNDKEALIPNISNPQRYHTDPTPLWITDHSYQLSFVNLYYWRGSQPWYWDAVVIRPPTYIFDFESNEGYDTDNDGIPDHKELPGSGTPGVTNPLDDEEPVKRRALKLDGTSAARVRGQLWHGAREYENFTIEAWVRPEVAASGADQVVVEKPIYISNNNPMGWLSGIRLNFRLALDATGHPYAQYHGSGFDPTTVDPIIVSPNTVSDNEWVHLAAVYDGTDQEFRLYVNGSQVAMLPSALIPVTGWFEGSPGYIVRGSFIVGASDGNPSGYVANSLIQVGSYAGYYPGLSTVPNEPSLSLFFTGWIDEVRLWDGVRTEGEIQDAMMKRMKREDILASRLDVGGPELTDLWTFDDLPDPDHDPVAPEGFDILNGRPNDGSYPSIPWWASATLKSKVYDNYHYIPWIGNQAAQIPRDPPYDSQFWGATRVVVTATNTIVITNEFPNAMNPYTFQYNRYLAGTALNTADSDDHFDYSSSARNSESPINQLYYQLYGCLLPLENAEADEDIELWDGDGTGRDPLDSDGDGLPDWWEALYHINPGGNTNNGGAFDDPDGDGLINLYEYQAFIDYGIQLDPKNFLSLTGGPTDFFLLPVAGGLTFGELYDDTDVLPDRWERLSPTVMNEDYYHRDQDPDGDGWDNQEEYIAGSDPNDPSSQPAPTVSGRLLFTGRAWSDATDGVAPFFHVLAYETAGMDTTPVGVGTVTAVDSHFEFTMSNVHSRVIWLFAWGSADSYAGFDAGDAYGVLGPVAVSLVGAADVEIPMLEQLDMPWFTAFEWPMQPGILNYYVRIVNAGLPNGPVVLTDTVRSDRRWIPQSGGGLLKDGTMCFFQAMDYREGTSYAGDLSHGLPPGHYAWQVKDSEFSAPGGILATGTFHVTSLIPGSPTTIPDIEIVSPMGGDIVVNQHHDFTFRIDPERPAPRYDIMVAPTNGAWSLTKTIYATPDDTATPDLCKVRLPLAGTTDGDTFGYGIWQNGMGYTWSIRAHDNATAGNWSAARRFQLAVTNEPLISGTAYYYGKAPASNVIVRAYRAPGNSDRIEGQMKTAITSDSADFALYGLRSGASYTLEAFIDLDMDGVRDEWEPQGIARDPSTGARYQYRADAYAIGIFSLVNIDKVENVVIVIRDRDTDNDNVMDGWEWENLHNSPRGMNNSGSDDLDGDGLSNVQEYGLNTNPRVADTDGDGLSDGDEVSYGTSSFETDSDGDTLLDGDEVARGLSPMNTDDDADGVPTAVEVAWDGVAGSISAADMNPGVSDTDGDSVVDLMEVASGSDPVNGADAKVIAITGIERGALNSAILSWAVGRNDLSIDVTYTVEHSADMLTWTAVGELTSNGDAAATLTLTDSSAPANGGFYRLRLEIK